MLVPPFTSFRSGFFYLRRWKKMSQMKVAVMSYRCTTFILCCKLQPSSGSCNLFERFPFLASFLQWRSVWSCHDVIDGHVLSSSILNSIYLISTHAVLSISFHLSPYPLHSPAFPLYFHHSFTSLMIPTPLRLSASSSTSQKAKFQTMF